MLLIRCCSGYCLGRFILVVGLRGVVFGCFNIEVNCFFLNCFCMDFCDFMVDCEGFFCDFFDINGVFGVFLVFWC